MAAGVGESIICELVAQVIFKALRIAYHIVKDARHYREDENSLLLRLQVQAARLEAVAGTLNNPVISSGIRPRDRHTYVHVMRKLHRLLIDYVVHTEAEPEQTKLLVDENSAEDLFKEMEEQDPFLADPSPEQEKFWLSAKEKVIWAVKKKRHLEKLVVEVEIWGECLDTLMSTTIPLIFIRRGLSAAEIAENTPGKDLSHTNTKSRILIEKRVEEESIRSNMSGLRLGNAGTASSVLQYSQLRFLSQRSPSPFSSRGANEDRSDLGGATRRQWAQLFEEDGKLKEARVIVEFKERPPPREYLYDIESVEKVKRELRSLVRELRLAGKSGMDFRVLYCHGFYEANEHYGLVYQLPPTEGATEGCMQCESLGNILLDSRYTQLLEANVQNRLDLAKSLANTMYHLHSVQWLHKSFNPDNILLFGYKSPSGVRFDWTRPYVVGFDASRANRADSDRLPPSLRWENRVYTHPLRQRTGEYARFQKIFDIYSLGVVLLEIGMLRCFKHLDYRKDPKWTEVPGNDIKARFVEIARGFKRVMGRTYAEIVEVCLTGEFRVAQDEEDADETRLLEAFRSEVCERFEQVHY